jgi:hypothetical protein
MKVKIKNIIDGIQALSDLSSQKFPVKVSYKIGRILNDCQRELKHYEASRIALVNSLGEVVGKDAMGEPQYAVMKPEALKEFQKQYSELVEIETTLWGDKLKLDDLGDKEIEPAIIAALDWLFVDFEEEDKAVTAAA